MSQRKEEGLRKRPASPPKPKFNGTASSLFAMPSGSGAVTSWPCEFCNERHVVKTLKGRLSVFCPMLGAKVYAPSGLIKPTKGIAGKPDWTRDHKFIDTEFGVICSDCGGSYDKLEMEAKAEVLR